MLNVSQAFMVPWSFLDSNPAEDRMVPFNVAVLEDMMW